MSSPAFVSWDHNARMVCSVSGNHVAYDLGMQPWHVGGSQHPNVVVGWLPMSHEMLEAKLYRRFHVDRCRAWLDNLDLVRFECLTELRITRPDRGHDRVYIAHLPGFDEMRDQGFAAPRQYEFVGAHAA